jgi:hypothetical protein
MTSRKRKLKCPPPWPDYVDLNNNYTKIDASFINKKGTFFVVDPSNKVVTNCIRPTMDASKVDIKGKDIYILTVRKNKKRSTRKRNKRTKEE